MILTIIASLIMLIMQVPLTNTLFVIGLAETIFWLIISTALNS